MPLGQSQVLHFRSGVCGGGGGSSTGWPVGELVFLGSTLFHPLLKVAVPNDKFPGRGKTSEVPVGPWASQRITCSGLTPALGNVNGKNHWCGSREACSATPYPVAAGHECGGGFKYNIRVLSITETVCKF